MKRTSWGIAVLGGIFAISWLSTEIACACVPAWVELADELELNVKHESEFTIPNIQLAYNKKFRGQPLLSLVPPKTGRSDDCAQVSPSQLNCKNWLKSGLLWKKGLQVSFFADTKGQVERVEVSDTLGLSWL